MNIFLKIRRKIYKAFHPVLGEIWMLHRVIPEEQRSQIQSNRDLEITPDFLEAKIAEYQRKGYRFVTIDFVREILDSISLFSCAKSQKFVCITFDDGYNDNYEYALPIFRKYQVPFAVYVSTDFIDNCREMWWYSGQHLALNKEQLLQLDQEPLCTIGAHTLSHPKLDELTLEAQREELVGSKYQLESWLGHPISHFSYPHGAYNDDTIKIVSEANFSTSLMAWGGVVRKGMSLNALPRLIIKQ